MMILMQRRWLGMIGGVVVFLLLSFVDSIIDKAPSWISAIIELICTLLGPNNDNFHTCLEIEKVFIPHQITLLILASQHLLLFPVFFKTWVSAFMVFHFLNIG
jgi:hypothetical protein